MADMISLDLSKSSGAHISSCENYRYILWRMWSINDPICVFIMLNPSTADAEKNDPTITRCINRAKFLGYGGILVVNLFAYRTSKPSELFSYEGDKVGRSNYDYIKFASKIAKSVICAWGDGGSYDERDQVVKTILVNEFKVKLTHLGLTKSGNPLHPSARGKSQCIPYKQQPIHWI